MLQQSWETRSALSLCLPIGVFSSNTLQSDVRLRERRHKTSLHLQARYSISQFEFLMQALNLVTWNGNVVLANVCHIDKANRRAWECEIEWKVAVILITCSSTWDFLRWLVDRFPKFESGGRFKMRHSLDEPFTDSTGGWAFLRTPQPLHMSYSLLRPACTVSLGFGGHDCALADTDTTLPSSAGVLCTNVAGTFSRLPQENHGKGLTEFL